MLSTTRLVVVWIVLLLSHNDYYPLVVVGLDNGLALTPPMGISTWSVFRGEINHTLVIDLADTIVDLEIFEAGYTYLLIDAGWSTNQPNCTSCLSNRNENGTLVIDTTKFPDLKATIDHVHARGLKFGLWFGVEMCADTNDEGSKAVLPKIADKQPIDYAEEDAHFFAALGVDAIKHDNCNELVPNTTEGLAHNYHKYERMSLALNQTGRPILYDVTLQVNKPRSLPAYDYNYIWSPEPYGRDQVQRISHMWWSMPLNKYNCWRCYVHPQENIVDDKDCNNPHKLAAWRGLLPTLDIQDLHTDGWQGHWDWAGRGKGWNHLDQLSVCTMGPSWYGPGLTKVEQVAQISLWAVMAAPLILSVDTRILNKGNFCHTLITNPLLIQVHQDELGIPGRPRINNYDNSLPQQDVAHMKTQVWARPLRRGQVAAVFFNRMHDGANIQATFEEVGLAPSVARVTVTNVWTHHVQQGVSSPLVVTSVVPHGVTFLILTPEAANDKVDYSTAKEE